MIGLIDFLSFIVPVFLISDTYFIEVFSAKHMFKQTLISDSSFGLRETDALMQPLIDGIQ